MGNYKFGSNGPFWGSRSMLNSSFAPDPSGNCFYVDANVVSGGNGLSWDEAKKTIATGLAQSHADISLSANRAWARRNTVYYCGDSISETLILAAEKTDLIGVGSDVGSTPKITGNFTIGTARSSFRIINMGFVPTTTAPVLTFPSGMHGWELHHVKLFKVEGVTNSAMLLSTDCRDFVMKDTYIYPDAGAAKSTIGFNIAGTTAGVGRAIIEDCLIVGTEAFNVVNTSAYYEGAVCKRTTFIATALCIDENSDSIAFIDCRLSTAANSGSVAGSTIVDWNAALACGNEAISGNHNGPLPGLDIHA